MSALILLPHIDVYLQRTHLVSVAELYAQLNQEIIDLTKENNTEGLLQFIDNGSVKKNPINNIHLPASIKKSIKSKAFLKPNKSLKERNYISS